MSDTHYILSFTSRHQRLQMAACGKHVYLEQHSAEPTCQRCAAWVDADAKDADLLRQQWDDERDAERAKLPPSWKPFAGEREP